MFDTVVDLGKPVAELSIGAGLPEGLALDSDTGIIGATPTTAGVVTITAQNSAGLGSVTETGTVGQRPSLHPAASIPPKIVGEKFPHRDTYRSRHRDHDGSR